MIPPIEIIIRFDGKGHFDIDAPVQNLELCLWALDRAKEAISQSGGRAGTVAGPDWRQMLTDNLKGT